MCYSMFKGYQRQAVQLTLQVCQNISTDFPTEGTLQYQVSNFIFYTAFSRSGHVTRNWKLLINWAGGLQDTQGAHFFRPRSTQNFLSAYFHYYWSAEEFNYIQKILGRIEEVSATVVKRRCNTWGNMCNRSRHQKPPFCTTPLIVSSIQFPVLRVCLTIKQVGLKRQPSFIETLMVLILFPGLVINTYTNFQKTLPRVVSATTLVVRNHSLQLATTSCSQPLVAISEFL